MKKRVFVSTLSILVLFLLVSINSSVFAQDAKPFLGTWKGSLAVMGMDMEIIIELSLDDTKNIQGTIDILTMGAEDLPLGEFAIDGKKITFKIIHPEAQGDPTFNGTLDEAGKKIEGSFAQSGMEGTFIVTKE